MHSLLQLFFSLLRLWHFHITSVSLYSPSARRGRFIFSQIKCTNVVVEKLNWIRRSYLDMIIFNVCLVLLFCHAKKRKKTTKKFCNVVKPTVNTPNKPIRMRSNKRCNFFLSLSLVLFAPKIQIFQPYEYSVKKA